MKSGEEKGKKQEEREDGKNREWKDIAMATPIIILNEIM